MTRYFGVESLCWGDFVYEIVKRGTKYKIFWQSDLGWSEVQEWVSSVFRENEIDVLIDSVRHGLCI